jgi:hypothetical protein
VRAYQEACAKHGVQKQLGQDMIWGTGLYLAASQEEAIRKVEPAHDERYKWFAPFGFVRYADDQGRPWGTPGAPTGVPSLEEGVRQKAWLLGPVAGVVDRLRDLESEYPGLEHIVLHWPEGMPAGEWIEQLRLFAHEVMPAFEVATTAGGR